MEPSDKTITDLPVDILNHIMLLLVKSCDGVENSENASLNEGAANFARAIAVSKVFNQFADDKIILKAIDFGDVRPYFFNESYWESDGLLARCARTGNESAFEILKRHIETFATNHDNPCMYARLVMAGQLLLSKRQLCITEMPSIYHQSNPERLRTFQHAALRHIRKIAELRNVIGM